MELLTILAPLGIGAAAIVALVARRRYVAVRDELIRMKLAVSKQQLYTYAKETSNE